MASLLLMAQAGPAENLSIFEPVSPAGVAIRDLAVIVLAVTGVIFLIVEAVLIYSIVRFRRRAAADPANSSEPPQVYGSQPIEIAWTAAPALIVFVLMLVVVRTEWEVRPSIPAPKEGDNALYVTVVGRQWWWEYHYDFYNGRKLGVITANELHLPVSDGVDRPVYLTLKSADVCHSFWVPRLGGKTDLIPGKTNVMWIQSKQPGLFLGQCAEFCGTQHAKMLLRANVESAVDFEKWLANEEQPPIAPTTDELKKGRDVFVKQACASCHRIAGVSAGTYAPDLTHLMSRQTLASGILANTKDNLREWILNPQKFKPGCLMAPFDFRPAEIDALVEYLRSLK
jgi:cytochrome c oxidase subunit 2